MIQHRYTLQKYQGPGSKHTCPQCKKSKVFTYYVDNETGMMVHPSVGRCDRESNCGYHYKPRDYFRDNNILTDEPLSGQIIQQKKVLKRVSYTPTDMMEATLKAYKRNNFANFLIGLLGRYKADEVLSRYLVGTANYWPGATVFWQVDTKGKVRAGKIILYDMETGRRVKEPFSHITWVHSVLNLPDYHLKQCLFGEHLLSDTIKPIAIVESEKTAVIASAYLHQYTWLAAGGLSNLTAQKCKVLKGRSVILYPDLKAYDKWDQKRKELSMIMPDTQFEISDILEKNASDLEREEGWDIADYLVKFHKTPLSEQVKGFHDNFTEL